MDRRKLLRVVLVVLTVFSALLMMVSPVMAQTAIADDHIPLPTDQIDEATAALAKLGALQYLAFVLAISLFFSALSRIRRHR